MISKLTLTLLLVVPNGLAAVLELDVEFGAPAQASGNLHVRSGQWLAVVTQANAASLLEMELPSGTVVTNSTWVSEGHENPQVPLSGGIPAPLPADTHVWPASILGNLRFAHPWASLIIVAETIEIDSSSWAELDIVNPGDWIANQKPMDMAPYGTFQFRPHPALTTTSGVALGMQAIAPRAPFPVSINATGIRHMEWLNVQLDCNSSCPDSGDPWNQSIAQGTVMLRRRSFIHFESSNGSLFGDATVVGLAIGGQNLVESVDGTLRLPSAYLSGDCFGDSCPDSAGRTFLANGNLTLSQLTRTSDSRLQGLLHGQFTKAAFDEAPQERFSAGTTVIVGLAVIGLVWLGKLLTGLFARTARPPALLHPQRRALFTLIQKQPGLAVRELQRALAWPTGTLSFHLARLVDSGHVVAHRERNTVRHFENHGRYGKTWRQVASLRDPLVARLHDWLLQHPGVSQAGIVIQTATWEWSRDSTRRRLNRLMDAGLLTCEEHGRRNQYHAKPPLSAT